MQNVNDTANKDWPTNRSSIGVEYATRAVVFAGRLISEAAAALNTFREGPQERPESTRTDGGQTQKSVRQSSNQSAEQTDADSSVADIIADFERAARDRDLALTPRTDWADVDGVDPEWIDTSPQQFADAHRTATGALHLDGGSADAWITSDTTTGVRR